MALKSLKYCIALLDLKLFDIMKKLSLLCLLALMACNEGALTVHQEEVQQIDKMLSQIDSMQVAFDAVNAEKVADYAPEADSLYKILTGPMADTSDKNYWINVLGDISYVVAPLKKFYRDGPKIEEGLSTTKKQLETLRNSLVDEQLDSLKAKEYFSVESQAFGDLWLLHAKRVLAAKDAVAIWDTAANRYLELAAKSDSLVQ